jgi:2-polyprenyl-6-methoxyphenol hydroxylase-like FAD-dependent oxidoreductase
VHAASSLRSRDLTTCVLVVGSGPTGLLLASELVRRDVDCLLIDAHDTPLGWDRATVVHERTIEVFEALGLADDLIDQSVKVRGAQLRSDGSPLGVVNLGSAGSRYRFDLGVSEEVVESVLTRLLEDHGGAVTRSTLLVGIRDDGDRLVATLEQGGSHHDVSASWIVGCDGFHSTTRQLAGIDYPGTDLAVPWAVFDASIDGWDEAFDLNFAHFDVPPVLLCPLPDRRWRVYVHPSSDTSDMVADASATVRRYAPDAAFVAVENPKRFRCHSRVASHYRSGRVFLAGDAAHACSPSEGHGMNTGLQDAFNLGWKLALACGGMHQPALLDSYEAERRPVALRIVASGDAFESNQAMIKPDERTERDVAMRHMLADGQSVHNEVVAAAELDRSYADSALVQGDAGQLLGAGDLVPDGIAVETPSGEARALHELAQHPGHTVFIIGGKATNCDDVAHAMTLVHASIGDSPAFSAVVGLCVVAARPGIGRIDESVADHIGVERLTMLAVRPDRFVGLRHDGGDLAPLVRYFHAFTN